MCGIAGIASLPGHGLPASAVVEAMCQRIVHRGPDDQGIHGNATARIGMRRLAIIDLGGGHQPIANEDRTVWTVFNGEIYNFGELRRSLEARGHVFASRSDTECIVHAYEEYGDDCFSKLRGMFAIAILDERRERLLLARDRLGEKPLYYTSLSGRLFAFASELKSLLEVPGFERVVSPQALREFVSLGYVPSPGTIYEGVRKLPPAHYLVLERGRSSLHRYWSLAYGPKWADDDRVLRERLLEHLDDAVRVRLVSDVPFGVFLSGGLDSSVVAALMARNLGAPVEAFTIGFREDEYDELPDAKRIARHIGARHHERVMEADAIALLPRLVWHCDEPFGDASAIPTFLVSQLAASHVKMALSGDGGDEAFAGYDRYGRYLRLDAVARASLGAAAPLVHLAGAIARGHLAHRLDRIATRMRLPWPDRYLSGVAMSTIADAASLLSPEISRLDPFSRVRGRFDLSRIREPAERLLAGDMETYLPDDVLVKVDRMTMANSLESRAPLLDHVLLEFCARLPLRLKRDGARTKVLLREVARDLLPPEALRKRKQGFGVPLARWFRAELRPMIADLISDRRFRERGVFQPRGVRACLDRHVRGEDDCGELLWLVLTYELWARTFLDRSAVPARAALGAAR